MNSIIALITGVVIGVPAGWALLFLLAASCSNTKKLPTKEEWKQM